MKKTSLRANALSQAVPLAAGYSLNLLVTPLMLSNLGLVQFGIWSLSGALSQYGALLDFGITRSVTRYIAFYDARQDKRAERRVRAVAIAFLSLLGLMLFGLFYFAAPLIQKLIPVENLADLRTLLSASVVILVAGLLARAVASMSFGRGRMVGANIALAVSNVVSVGAGAVTLIAGGDLYRFATVTALGAVIGLSIVVLTVWALEGELLLAMPVKDESLEMLKFGVKGQAVSVSDLLILQSGKVILGVVVGPAAVGLYEIGSRLALGARALGVVVTMAGTPVLSAKFAVGGMEAVKKDYVDMTSRITAMSLFAPGLVGVLSPFLVIAWLGEQSGQVSTVVTLLCGVFIFNLCTGTQTIAANAVGQPGVVAKSALQSALVNVIIIYPMTVWLGLWGALISIAVSTIFGVVAETMYVHQLLDIPLKAAMKGILVPLLATMIACFVTWLATVSVNDVSRFQAVLMSGVGMVVFIVTYTLSLIIGRQYFYRPTYRVKALIDYGRADIHNSYTSSDDKIMESENSEN